MKKDGGGGGVESWGNLTMKTLSATTGSFASISNIYIKLIEKHCLPSGGG